MSDRIRLKVIKPPRLNLRVMPHFPGTVEDGPGITVAKNGGAYIISFNVATSGLQIGSNVQGWDADLEAIANLTTIGLAARTVAGTWALRTITGTANEITVTNGDAVAGNPTLSLPPAITAAVHAFNFQNYR